MSRHPGSRPANRLAREQSPYLLQHSENPVDWYPWGEEAFARARAEERPIFLSVGYSTCHWCHVMERESFENDDVAALLNAHFVCVKVDREERPDVDRLYMTAAHAMGVGGGWPLNLFLTPGLEPFWGGTYFPPTSQGSRPGMMELLPRVHAAWEGEREAIVAGGRRVLEAVAGLATPEAAPEPHELLAAECADWLARMRDAEEGGFGDAPKFPSPANLGFLFRWWAREPGARAEARAMALRQLDAMRSGGIHDHLGGGFHRYATDRAWLVPHFEKMLYDQALIADAYLDGFEVTRDPACADTARDVFAYVLRDLLEPCGAFASAEDADSEGEEGRFYVWSPAQFAGALAPDDARVAAAHWGVTATGNFEHGASILHERRSPAATAAALALPEAAVRESLARARAALHGVRSKRVRPHRDDKVIASWNGLMIAALARGGRVLGDEALTAAAARAATFVWSAMREPGTGALRRCWRRGDAGAAGQLDDHAYVTRGLLELYATTHDPAWLARAVALTETQVARFWDDAHGAFFESPGGDAGVPVRMKDGFDGAELAGNSVALETLAALAGLLPRPDWQKKAARMVEYFSRRLAGASWAMPRMLAAMDRAARPARHVIVAGEASPERDALLAAHRGAFRPFDDLVLVDDTARPALSVLAPFAAGLRPVDGRATAYLCVDRACRLPVTGPREFAAQLDEGGPSTARPTETA